MSARVAMVPVRPCTARRRGGVAIARAALALAIACAAHRPAPAQDFGSAAAALPDGRALAALEHGLLSARAAPGIEVAWTSWHSLPDFVTRAAAVGGGWGAARVIAGVSQTGDEALGWSAAGIAAGVATRTGGAAVRAVARRDRMVPAAAPVPGPGTGFEAGAAAWIEAGAGLRAWISGPQIVTRGESPPLRRGLECGAWWGGGGIDGWVARTGSAGLGNGVTRRIGVRLRNGPLALWAEARDPPVRGSIGVAAQAAGVAIDVSVESHPVLGETVRVTFEWSGRTEEP